MTDALLSALSEHHRPHSRHWFWIVDDPPPPTIADIKATVAIHYGVTVHDLVSERRTGNVIIPRHVAMHLAKTLTRKSLPEIGGRFGRRNHTTVLYAVRKIAKLIKADEKFAVEIAKLEGMFA